MNDSKWECRIAKVMTVIEKSETVDICRDPKNNMF